MDYEFLQLQLQECESASEQQTQASTCHMLSASLLNNNNNTNNLQAFQLIVFARYLLGLPLSMTYHNIETAMHACGMSHLSCIVSTQTPHTMQLA